MDTSVHPPQVTRLHHRFEGWLGDDLIECFPCFMITDRLARLLKDSRLTGFELEHVEISKSLALEEMYPHRQLPDFWWLKIIAVQPSTADFRLTHDHHLEVSDAALALLRKAQIDHADIRRS